MLWSAAARRRFSSARLDAPFCLVVNVASPFALRPVEPGRVKAAPSRRTPQLTRRLQGGLSKRQSNRLDGGSEFPGKLVAYWPKSCGFQA